MDEQHNRSFQQVMLLISMNFQSALYLRDKSRVLKETIMQTERGIFISGNHTIGADEDFGRGKYLMDFIPRV